MATIPNLKKLINGGYTHWLTKRRDTGYLCALKAHELKLELDGNEIADTHLAAALFYLGEHITDEGINTIGSWRHEGYLYLDCCVWFHSYTAAMNFAKRQEQIAIWSLAAKVELNVAEYFAAAE